MLHSVKGRLLALTLVAVVALVLLVGMATLAMRSLGEQQDAVYERSKTASVALEASRLGVQFYRVIADAVINRDLVAAVAQFSQLRAEADGDLAVLEKLADTPAEKGSVAKAKEVVARIDRTFRERLLPVLTGDNSVDERIRSIDAEVDADVLALRTEMKRMADSMGEEAVLADQAFDATRQRTVTTALVIGVLATLALLVFALYIMRSILRPLDMAKATAERIAAGDLTSRVEVSGRDEFADMLHSCARMQDTLREMIGSLQDSAQKIAAMSEQMAATTQQISGATEQQAQSASSMAASVEEMSVSISQVSDHAGDVRRAATHSGKVAQEGRTVVDQLVAGNTETQDAVEAAAQRLRDMAALSQQISSIVQVIREVAEQTNLLALNAAIEAARAGEQGRGFAVVADEVRKLAERTGQSTQDISKMIAQVQDVTQDVVERMGNAVSQVRGSTELSGKTNDSIDQIGTESQRVVTAVEEITNALREQSAASNDIARRVEQIAQMSEENSAAVKQTAAAAGELERMASSLQASAGRFRLV